MTPSESLSPGIHILNSKTPLLKTILESIADIHASCILRDNTMATFLPPLSRPELVEHWQKLCDETDDDSRLILIHISKTKDRSSTTTITTTETIKPPFEDHDWLSLSSNRGERDEMQSTLEVSGVVSLSMPASQTGPFRGLVQKLFISPHHRRKGIASRLVADLEQLALERGRWSLMLDTTVGTSAENLYPKLGYNVLGVVKDYGFTPKNHTLADEIFFWKDLRTTSM